MIACLIILTALTTSFAPCAIPNTMECLTLKGPNNLSCQVRTGLFINNKYQPSRTGSTIKTYDPYSGDLLGILSAAEEQDIDLAVDAANEAFYSGWKQTPGVERGNLLNKLAELIDRDAEDFAFLHALDGGFVPNDVKEVDVKVASAVLRHFAGWSDKLSGKIAEMTNGTGYVRREPIGICGLIIPWNAPLMITCWKLAPAIAAGNVLIIKTPELAPLVGQKLAELIAEAGFPPGVINIVTGLGTTAGKAIAKHARIWKVSFTGSTLTGRSILQASALSNLKKVTLELGGKGPSIVFKDAAIKNAIFWTYLGAFINNGQVCALGSRIYVQNEIFDDFLERFQAYHKVHPSKAGSTFEPGVTKGPIISRAQHQRIMSYIAKGKEEGARLVFGGNELLIQDRDQKEHVSGFVENTLFTDVTEDMTIVRDEIFGPVATLHRFKTEAEVIDKANASRYGLSSSIFTSDIDRARRVSAAIECGQVCINGWGLLSVNIPFGGNKESGFGRDMGEESLEAWTNVKSITQWHLEEGST